MCGCSREGVLSDGGHVSIRFQPLCVCVCVLCVCVCVCGGGGGGGGGGGVNCLDHACTRSC